MARRLCKRSFASPTGTDPFPIATKKNPPDTTDQTTIPQNIFAVVPRIRPSDAPMAGLIESPTSLAFSPVVSPMTAPMNVPMMEPSSVPRIGIGIRKEPPMAPPMPPMNAPTMPRLVPPPALVPAAPASPSTTSPMMARTNPMPSAHQPQ